LAQVPKVARQLIADLLEMDPEKIDVSVRVELEPELRTLVDQYEEATVMEDAARAEAAHARSRSAAGLIDARLTMRDAAILLGISHQRVKQLVDRAKELETALPSEESTAVVDLLVALMASVEAKKKETRVSRKADIA
jgi:site-specific recombinase